MSYEKPYRIPRVDNKKLLDPHVVIIGAGASLASCRKDRNGIKVPLLKNIHQILGLTEEIGKYDFTVDEIENFEMLYSHIYDKDKYNDLTVFLNKEITSYFQRLELPEKPTNYDYLILSLTSKDAIISFNWDPFLIQAYRRNINVGNLPVIIFPHGNVGVGLCYNCRIKGYAKCICPKCHKKLENMPLLFPIDKKDYKKDVIIENEWNLAKKYLSCAAGMTIYGYGAPETDIEAQDLLKTTYKTSNLIEIAPFEIINLASEKENQLSKWRDIFSDRMIRYLHDFRESLLWHSPRASLEYNFSAILQQRPKPIKKSYRDFSNLDKLQKFVLEIDDNDMSMY